MVDLLKPFAFTILVDDPFLTGEEATDLGVDLVALNDNSGRQLIGLPLG